jgi:hypothetical protein
MFRGRRSGAQTKGTRGTRVFGGRKRIGEDEAKPSTDGREMRRINTQIRVGGGVVGETEGGVVKAIRIVLGAMMVVFS